VRKGGLEPPRYCYRQPLKLVRLPIPPLPQAGNREDDAVPKIEPLDYLGVEFPAGVAAEGIGEGATDGAGAGPSVPPTTDPGPR
jgi:hypothetical protein